MGDAGRTHVRGRWRAGLMLLAAAAAAGCGAGPARLGGGPPSSQSPEILRVMAASSLADVLPVLARRLETARPGVEVAFSFAGSSGVARQLEDGAPVDVVATADQTSMRRLAAAGLVGRVEVFARNRLEILVAPGNPMRVTSLDDLAQRQLVLVACSRTVPCGRAAAKVLDRAGVPMRPRSLEENVKAVVAKVVLGEADAGLVYATDVVAAGERGHGVPIPEGLNAWTSYSIAVASGTSRDLLASAFVEAVLDRQGRAVLRRAGFAP